MNPVWLLRMVRWLRRPPSVARVKLVLGVVAACLVLVAVEWAVGWPEALEVHRIARP